MFDSGIKTSLSAQEYKYLQRIAKRARDSHEELCGEIDLHAPLEESQFFMELFTAYTYCPLDLKAFANASEYEFSQELTGILTKLDHGQKSFFDWWKPQFALQH